MSYRVSVSLAPVNASSWITNTRLYTCAYYRISSRRYSVSWGIGSPGGLRAIAYIVGGLI